MRTPGMRQQHELELVELLRYLQPAQQQSAVRGQPAVPRPEFVDWRDFFIYMIPETGPLALAAGVSLSAQVQIEAESDFYLIKLAGFADIAGAAQTESTRVLPLVTIQLTETGSGRSLFNAPTPWDALIGRGELPFIVPMPHLYKGTSTVRATFANFSAATAYNLRLALIGYKDWGKLQVRNPARP